MSERGILPVTLFTALLAGLAGCGESAPPEAWDGSGMLAIEGATVFTSPRVAPLENAVILVVDGVIEAIGEWGSVVVPPAALRVNGVGHSVLAGFWNGHVQVDAELLETAATGSAQELDALLRDRFTRFGFTTVVETGSPRGELTDLVERIESGEVPGPRILAVGDAEIPGVHLPTAADLPWSVELLERLAAENVAVVPALGLLLDGAVADQAGRARVDLALERLGAFVRSGGTLLYGTGAAGGLRYDPSLDHLLLEEAGIPFAERLAALTTRPATLLGFDYLGELQPGMVADLVMVEGDPEVDTTAFERIRLVLREGRPLYAW